MPEDNNNNDKLPHLVGAVCGGLVSHPFRVAMNRAAYHSTILGPFMDIPRHWTSGIHINLPRCIIAVGSQSYANQLAKSYYPQNAVEGKVAGLLAATAVGTSVATSIETFFIRKTMDKPLQNNLPLFRFSTPLIGCYFLREFFFSSIMFTADKLSSTEKNLLLVPAAGFTGIFHKFAAWEATADISVVQNKGSTPNFKQDGFFKSVVSLAKGDKYTHPSCKVLFPNATSIGKLATNLAFVSCGPAMFATRFTYSLIMREACQFGVKNHESLLFWRKKALPDAPARAASPTNSRRP
jgi:hypothetical protein